MAVLNSLHPLPSSSPTKTAVEAFKKFPTIKPKETLRRLQSSDTQKSFFCRIMMNPGRCVAGLVDTASSFDALWVPGSISARSLQAMLLYHGPATPLRNSRGRVGRVKTKENMIKPKRRTNP